MENRNNRNKKRNRNKNNQNTKTNTTIENTEVLDNKAENKEDKTTADQKPAAEVKTETKAELIKEEKIPENTKTTPSLDSMIGKDVKDFSADHIKGIAMNAAKIVLPVAACAIVIAVIITYAGSQKAQTVNNNADHGESGIAVTGVSTLSEEPLAENAYVNVNDMIRGFYNAQIGRASCRERV